MGTPDEYSPVFLAIAFAVPAIIAPLVSTFLVELLVELNAAQPGLVRLATEDELTKLNNRRYFLERLREEITRAHRSARRVCSLMIDADSFKAINDQHGHGVGDEILKQIAVAIKTATRPYDLVARFGGEEFTVLLPETVLAEACLVAERIRLAVAAISIALENGKSVNVTVSVGIAESNAKESDEKELLQRADIALYAAKKAGRNCWVCQQIETSI